MDDAPPIAPLRSSLPLLTGLAAIVLVIHFALGNGYGLHRDELQFLDDARHLQFGYVAYPPLTAFCGRVAIALFGISPAVFRLPAALANSVSLILVGLTARELGAPRVAQALALTMSFAVALTFSSVLQYNTFDYFAWALATLFTARLLRIGDERNWLGIGAAIGIGVLSKYSIAMLAISIVAAFLLSPEHRQQLRRKWFYLGAALTLLIAAPNLVWLASHGFITLQMEHFIHVRDVRLGRTRGYFSDQIKFTLTLLPLLLLGLVWLWQSRRFRPLAFFFLGPFVLFALAKGRGYYLLPAYIPLNAAGALALHLWLRSRSTGLRRVGIAAAFGAAVLPILVFSAMFLPIAKPGSRFFAWQTRVNSDMADEIGWPEFVQQAAQVYNSLTPEEKSRAAILAENYGEAGALALYGPEHGLPVPISEVNSFHDRGFGPYPPETVVVTGADYDDLAPYFESCRLGGHVQMPYGVQNEESRAHPDIFLCRHLRQPWATLWPSHQHFG